MQTEIPDITVKIILISTAMLLFLSGSIIYFLFFYQRKQLKNESEKKELKDSIQKMLLEAKIAIQEQTLDDIGRELHSNISQLASLININLSIMLANDPLDNKENVLETKSLAKQLLTDLKAINTSLNTDLITKMGFVKALEKELERLAQVNYEISFIKKGKEYYINPDKGMILFRLSQEILNNILKHADAKTVSIELDYQPDFLKLSIKDDGKGMDLEQIERNRIDKASTGLLNIKKRAELIDGTVEIESEKDKGTAIHISIPNISDVFK